GRENMSRLNKQLDPALTGSDAEKLEVDLKKRIVGQDEAIQQIINIYQMNLAGMSSPGRPIGNFLFLGPTGSGKTRLVEATAEMGSILQPGMGFAACEAERLHAAGQVEDGLGDKINRAATEAARRKFTPEFMNRIDKTVVFHPLGEPQLRKILGIELAMVQ